MPRRKYAGRQNVRTKICRRKISRRKNARRKIVRLRCSCMVLTASWFPSHSRTRPWRSWTCCGTLRLHTFQLSTPISCVAEATRWHPAPLIELNFLRLHLDPFSFGYFRSISSVGFRRLLPQPQPTPPTLRCDWSVRSRDSGVARLIARAPLLTAFGAKVLAGRALAFYSGILRLNYSWLFYLGPVSVTAIQSLIQLHII